MPCARRAAIWAPTRERRGQTARQWSASRNSRQNAVATLGRALLGWAAALHVLLDESAKRRQVARSTPCLYVNVQRCALTTATHSSDRDPDGRQVDEDLDEDAVRRAGDRALRECVEVRACRRAACERAAPAVRGSGAA